MNILDIDTTRLIKRWWEALNNEASYVENSPSYSGKKADLDFLATELRMARRLYQALLEDDTTELEHYVRRAEERSQQRFKP